MFLHAIMAGAEFRKLITGRAAVNSARGIFTFNGQFAGYALADFMLGWQQQDTTPGPEVRGVVAEWRDGFFVPVSTAAFNRRDDDREP